MSIDADDPAVVDVLLARKDERLFTGRAVRATVLVCRIRNFSHFIEEPHVRPFPKSHSPPFTHDAPSPSGASRSRNTAPRIRT